MNAEATLPAPDAAAAQAPAQASAAVVPTVPSVPAADAKAAAPAPTPEQEARRKSLEAQEAVQKVVKSKEDTCAAEIAAVCQKHGCELIVGHSVKVRFITQ